MNSEDLYYFYGTVFGRTVKRLIRTHLLAAWKRVRKQEVIVSVGYGTPYLRHFYEKVPHCINLFPQAMGAIPWPAIPAAKKESFNMHSHKSLGALIHPSHWPLQEVSVDKLLIIHSLEFITNKEAFLNEAWRTLTPAGKLFLVVPNRHGPWSLAENTPFGGGTPFSYAAIVQTLDDIGFKVENVSGAVYFWPLKIIKNVKIASVFDSFTKKLFNRFPGVWIIEATKRAAQSVHTKGDRVSNLILSPATLSNAYDKNGG